MTLTTGKRAYHNIRLLPTDVNAIRSGRCGRRPRHCRRNARLGLGTEALSMESAIPTALAVRLRNVLHGRKGAHHPIE